MHRIIFFIFISLIMYNSHASTNIACFIASEKNHIIKQEGNCSKRHAPCSTFKIAISLMGYNEGILIDENIPEFSFKNNYTAYLESWKQPQNPTTWIKNSCVWFSRIITKKLGQKKFKDYIIKFNYGNKDILGDKGKNNGLTNSWLSSSLQISPIEQIKFLQKLNNNTLPVSLKAQKLTRNILFAKELINGWKLYGKTDTGSDSKNQQN